MNSPVSRSTARQTRWSAVTSSDCPPEVCSRSTSFTPLALTATIRVVPCASWTLVPTAMVSTRRPIGTAPCGVLTRASYGWHADTCCGDAVPTLNQTGELKLKIWCTSA